jgi:hypothetical protein
VLDLGLVRDLGLLVEELRVDPGFAASTVRSRRMQLALLEQLGGGDLVLGERLVERFVLAARRGGRLQLIGAWLGSRHRAIDLRLEAFHLGLGSIVLGGSGRPRGLGWGRGLAPGRPQCLGLGPGKLVVRRAVPAPQLEVLADGVVQDPHRGEA